MKLQLFLLGPACLLIESSVWALKCYKCSLFDSVSKKCIAESSEIEECESNQVCGFGTNTGFATHHRCLDEEECTWDKDCKFCKSDLCNGIALFSPPSSEAQNFDLYSGSYVPLVKIKEPPSQKNLLINEPTKEMAENNLSHIQKIEKPHLIKSFAKKPSEETLSATMTTTETVPTPIQEHEAGKQREKSANSRINENPLNAGSAAIWFSNPAKAVMTPKTDLNMATNSSSSVNLSNESLPFLSTTLPASNEFLTVSDISTSTSVKPVTEDINRTKLEVGSFEPMGKYQYLATLEEKEESLLSKSIAKFDKMSDTKLNQKKIETPEKHSNSKKNKELKLQDGSQKLFNSKNKTSDLKKPEEPTLDLVSPTKSIKNKDATVKTQNNTDYVFYNQTVISEEAQIKNQTGVVLSQNTSEPTTILSLVQEVTLPSLPEEKEPKYANLEPSNSEKQVNEELLDIYAINKTEAVVTHQKLNKAETDVYSLISTKPSQQEKEPQNNMTLQNNETDKATQKTTSLSQETPKGDNFIKNIGNVTEKSLETEVLLKLAETSESNEPKAESSIKPEEPSTTNFEPVLVQESSETFNPVTGIQTTVDVEFPVKNSKDNFEKTNDLTLDPTPGNSQESAMEDKEILSQLEKEPIENANWDIEESGMWAPDFSSSNMKRRAINSISEKTSQNPKAAPQKTFSAHGKENVIKTQTSTTEAPVNFWDSSLEVIEEEPHASIPQTDVNIDELHALSNPSSRILDTLKSNKRETEEQIHIQQTESDIFPFYIFPLYFPQHNGQKCNCNKK